VENTSFIYLVKRYWWVLLLGAALGGAAANYAASKMAPTYEAKVSLLSGPINASYDAQRAAGNLGRTYAGLASSGPVLERAIGTTHARTTVDALRKNVTAISNDVTRIVDVRVRDGGREMSANLANAVARQLISLGGANNTSAVDTFMTTPSIAALDAPHQDEVRAAAERLFGSAGPGRLRIVDPALVPSSPISPRVSLITLMGLFAGLLAAPTFGSWVLFRPAAFAGACCSVIRRTRASRPTIA
jgi:capsular polysaccharide biosynthesis protein